MTALTSAPDDSTAGGFTGFELSRPILQSLSDLGFTEPTPIQSEAIPAMLTGQDVLGQAATGTGKTAAFALPLLSRFEPRRTAGPYALVLVPTRELAIQVAKAIESYGARIGVRVTPVFGGEHIGRQLSILKRGADIIVATPGRAIDHLDRGTLDLSSIETVVLDEADEMLDMGFAEDLDAILGAAPKERQTVLFSATMPKRIEVIARRHQKDPVRITIAKAVPVAGEAPQVRQVAYMAHRSHKAATLARLLKFEGVSAALVFCRTRDSVDQLTDELNRRGNRAEAIHGGLVQEQRDRVMGRFRNETTGILVATDVAARGLDIDHLTHVVNFDVPTSPETYVHRIGRVGRAGRSGTAITLAEPRERRALQTIERVAKVKLPIETVPGLDDLKARRLDQLKNAVAEQVTFENDDFDIVVKTLSEDHDPASIAAAALRLAYARSNGTQEDENIPEPVVDLRDRKNDRGPRNSRDGGGEGGKRRPAPSGPMKKVFVGAGKSAGVRPQDLVGAVAGESSLSGRDVGSIQISDKFSLVEVPSASINEVVTALRNTTIKGKKVTVRRERYEK